jgi:hypothetical protein
MTVQFTQTSVSDLRKILVESGKYTDEQANEIKGKAKLVEAVMALESREDSEVNFKEVFAQAEVVPDVVAQVNERVKGSIPDITSYDWHDYVMSHFHADELQDGKYPKVDGLRRVAEILIGRIIISGPKDVFGTLTPDNTGRATVVYQVVFDTLGGQKVFSSVAGSYLGNTDDEYAVFPEAIAEVRAEARALRRALRLRAVSAEELTSKDTKQIVKAQTERISDGEWELNDNISSTQITFLTKTCEKLGIDLNKFICSGKETYADIKSIPKGVAVDMIKRLNEYQSSTNQSIVIPEEIKL